MGCSEGGGSWLTARSGKAPTYAAIEEAESLDLANVDQAAEEFRRRIMRLAEHAPEDT